MAVTNTEPEEINRLDYLFVFTPLTISVSVTDRVSSVMREVIRECDDTATSEINFSGAVGLEPGPHWGVDGGTLIPASGGSDLQLRFKGTVGVESCTIRYCMSREDGEQRNELHNAEFMYTTSDARNNAHGGHTDLVDFVGDVVDLKREEMGLDYWVRPPFFQTNRSERRRYA